MSKSPAPSNASHDSQDEAHGLQGTKGNAAKDKECQYCHQKFTSSSLGRHLDQYITKKKPDGIHNVEEIRRTRAGITRRTARGNRKSAVGGENEDVPSQSNDTSPTPQPPVATPAYLESLNKGPAGTSDIRFNRMNWQATGVITDSNHLSAPNTSVPATATPSAPTPGLTNNISAGTKRNFATFAADMTPSTTSESVRALELALREVLDAVRAATKRAAPPLEPFSFDFTAQTFPSLCLSLLPAPATLFKPSPFATSNTIPLSPPGPDQFQALQQRIPKIIDDWKWNALSYAQRHQTPGSATIAEEAEHLTRSAENHIEDANTHLRNAYANYINHPPDQRQHLWAVELLRAYKTEQDTVRETKERIDRITQEANQLQQQIDYLSRCQWPREMALWPPERSALNSRMQDELRALNLTANVEINGPEVSGSTESGTSSAIDPSKGDRWDFDRLVNKWKRHVREDRARRTGTQLQVNIPSGPGGASLDSHDSSGGSRDLIQRTATPPHALRKPLSETAGGHNTHQNSPIMNGHSTTGAGKQVAGTPHHYNSPTVPNQSSSKPSTPKVNVQIISDLPDHMARFAPWFKHQREQELKEKEMDEEHDRRTEKAEGA